MRATSESAAAGPGQQQNVKTIADVITNFKIIAGVASALVLMGFSASLYMSRLATKDDVRNSLTPMRSAVEAVDRQLEQHETRLQLLESTQRQQEQRSHVRDQQLFEIAVKLGATVVPGIHAKPPPVELDAGPQ